MGTSEAIFHPKKDETVLAIGSKNLSGIVSANVKYEEFSEKGKASPEYGEEGIAGETGKKITLEVVSSGLFSREIFEKSESLDLILKKGEKSRIFKDCRLIFSERFASSGEEREKFVFSVSQEERESG